MSHKNRDWSKYNKSLVNRGNIFLWVSPEVLTAWRAQAGKTFQVFGHSDHDGINTSLCL